MEESPKILVVSTNAREFWATKVSTDLTIKAVTIRRQRPESQDLVSKILQANDVWFTNHEEIMRNQQALLQNLEHQVSQIAKALTEHPQGFLPSNIEVNPQ